MKVETADTLFVDKARPGWLGGTGGGTRAERPVPRFVAKGLLRERAADAAAQDFRRHSGKGKGKQQGEGKGRDREEGEAQSFAATGGDGGGGGRGGGPQGHALLAARGSLPCPGIRWQA